VQNTKHFCLFSMCSVVNMLLGDFETFYQTQRKERQHHECTCLSHIVKLGGFNQHEGLLLIILTHVHFILIWFHTMYPFITCQLI